MKKNYVLDTNVLIQDPDALLKFEDNDVYLPLTVISELDGLKNSKNSDTAFSARRANRMIKSILNGKNSGNASIADGHGNLYVIMHNGGKRLPDGWDMSQNDNRILLETLHIKDRLKAKTVLVTNDVLMYVKATALNIPVEDYKNQQIHNIYKGRRKIRISSADINKFYSDGELSEDYLTSSYGNLLDDAGAHEFVLMESLENPKHTALGIYDKSGFIRKLEQTDEEMSGVTPQKVGQHFAKEALMTDINRAPLAIIQGPAGTAKTFLSIAAGLQMVKNGAVRQMLLLRPQSFFDAEIGFLPGDEQSKIDPLLRPYYDNLASVMEIMGIPQEQIPVKIAEYFQKGVIRAESFTYIRGRSITNSYIVVDEAQNASRGQIIGAVTRAGAGSKLVLCGDPEQVDNPKLDAYNNGLVYAMNRMKDSDLCYQVTLEESECKRSPLAMDAILRMIRD